VPALQSRFVLLKPLLRPPSPRCCASQR